MLTLLSEIHFWSTNDEIDIKDNDFGAYRYTDKKENAINYSHQSKKSYAEKRNYVWNLTNKKPAKLKDKLRELEEQIEQEKIVYVKWVDSSILQLMLSTGVLVNIFVDIHTGDAIKISFDKYLIGKLQSEYISDVLITRSHILCTYNDNQITIINLVKPFFKQNVPEKLVKLEPKIKNSELAGPTGRKLDRKMSININGDRLLVWWKSARDEMYPWSPLVKDQDRANIHVYSLTGLKLELICYRRTEFDPVGITFSATQPNIIHFVEQKVSRKGEVSIETSTYEITKNKLQQLLITSIPLQTHVCCHSFSPDNEKLLLGCIDGSVVLFDQGRGVTHVVKAHFIPTIVSWHLDGSLIFIANEQSKIQCFDVSLSCVKSQFINEENNSSNILDLSTYFRNQPTLLRTIWNKKPELPYFYGNYNQNDGLLLLIFERGPLGILRLFGTSGLKNDVHCIGFTPDMLVHEYVRKNQLDRAIGILLSLNWEIYGIMCLVSLQRIMNHLFRQILTPEREVQIQRALGSFYAPLQPISNITHSEYGEQVKDLTRKFFHLLLRYQLYEKAFCLAIDINDYDLFMDLYYCGRTIHDLEMQNAALNRAKELVNHSNCSSSHSSCSQCSDLSNEALNDWKTYDAPPLPITNKPTTNYMPPLPVTNRLCTSVLLNDSLFPPVRQTNPPASFYPTTKNFNVPLIPPVKVKSVDLISTNFGVEHKRVVPDVPVLPKNNLQVKSVSSFPRYSNAGPKFFTGNLMKEFVHRTVSLSIPPPPCVTNVVSKVSVARPLKVNAPLKVSPSVAVKPAGEKNVKFSDTVTAFIVPDISREKPLHVKEKVKKSANSHFTDPKQELADSLPLCHPNEEYLKDFAPISSNTSDDENPTSKIKVVHFGMV